VQSASRDALTFVVCPSFHGATLLGLLLNNHSRISALGDTNPRRTYDQLCACGARVSVCPFWQEVVASLRTERFSELDTLLPLLPWPLDHHPLEGSQVRISNNPLANRLVGRTVASAATYCVPLVWRIRPGLLNEYTRVWSDFYSLVRRLHGTGMVVDGMKEWRKVRVMAHALRQHSAVRVIHLVRDPRGFVASTLRHRPERGLRETAWRWADLHGRMGALASVVPTMAVRYEDLADNPREVMAAIFAFLGEDDEDVLSAPKFPEKHHLMGNAMLFSFDGTVRVDERWRSALSGQEQRAVLGYVGAMAVKYGYA
jgi:hypothetical protein